MILPDNDDPGYKHAAAVALSLLNAGCIVRVIEPPKGKDITEWLELGGTKEALRELYRQAQPLDSETLSALKAKWGLIGADHREEPPVSSEEDHITNKKDLWPEKLSQEAFHGLAGEFIRLVEPHTEADKAALLFQLLTAVGCYIGRGPYYQVGGDRHYPNLFTVIVAESSKGRKGTSWGEVSRLMNLIDDQWLLDRRVGGLSSGEGLLHAVRDPITERVPIKKDGRIDGYQDQITDHGVEDKRLLVVEGEFGLALQVAGRDGNTLSAILRLAWDGSPLRVLAKSNRSVCQKPHVSIVGHITDPELKALLTANDSWNGFSNRFLWVCSTRSKCLPFGGSIDELKLMELGERIKAAVQLARGVGRMDFSPDARDAWAFVYPGLSEGHSGLFGAVTGRAEAQAIRLAMLFALLDQSENIRLTHLRAALACWQYAEDSAQHIFGGRLGDSTSDDILQALREQPDGMTRTGIREHFQRNKSSVEITRALSALKVNGLAESRKQETGRRPREVWFAVSGGKQ